MKLGIGLYETEDVTCCSTGASSTSMRTPDDEAGTLAAADFGEADFILSAACLQTKISLLSIFALFYYSLALYFVYNANFK